MRQQLQLNELFRSTVDMNLASIIPYEFKKSNQDNLASRCSWEAGNQLVFTALTELFPVDTQRLNDVISTSMRRDHVASTLIRRHFDLMCLLGVFQVQHNRPIFHAQWQ